MNGLLFLCIMLVCEFGNQDGGTLTIQEDATEASSDAIVAPSHLIFLQGCDTKLGQKVWLRGNQSATARLVCVQCGC